MHDHRKKYFSSSLAKPISATALILTLSGHAFILYSLGKFAETNSKNSSETTGVVVRLLSEKLDQANQHIAAKNQSVHSLIQTEIPSLPAAPSLAEVPIGAQLPVQSYYFKSDELSQKPQVINDLPADFFLPDIAGLPEPLIMTLRISNVGTVDEVFIPGDIADSEKLLLITTAFKTMTFAAAQISGIAVPSEIRIEVWKNTDKQDEPAGK